MRCCTPHLTTIKDKHFLRNLTSLDMMQHLRKDEEVFQRPKTSILEIEVVGTVQLSEGGKS